MRIWLFDNARPVRKLAATEAPRSTQLLVSTDYETAVVVDVLEYAYDPDEDELSVVAVGQGTHGSVVDHEDGTVTYTPDEGYFGADEFTVTVSDGNGGTTQAVVRVVVHEDG
jgi:hypothetical protein